MNYIAQDFNISLAMCVEYNGSNVDWNTIEISAKWYNIIEYVCMCKTLELT